MIWSTAKSRINHDTRKCHPMRLTIYRGQLFHLPAPTELVGMLRSAFLSKAKVFCRPADNQTLDR